MIYTDMYDLVNSLFYTKHVAEILYAAKKL